MKNKNSRRTKIFGEICFRSQRFFFVLGLNSTALLSRFLNEFRIALFSIATIGTCRFVKATTIISASNRYNFFDPLRYACIRLHRVAIIVYNTPLQKDNSTIKPVTNASICLLQERGKTNSKFEYEIRSHCQAIVFVFISLRELFC